MEKIKLKFDDKYVDGHKTLERWVDVAGLHLPDRKSAVRRFASFKKQSVSMKPEPRNRHDRNAIAVYGHGVAGLIFKRRKKIFLGYVPAVLAKQIADKKLKSVAQIYLNQIDINDPYYHVKISISVPDDRR